MVRSMESPSDKILFVERIVPPIECIALIFLTQHREVPPLQKIVPPIECVAFVFLNITPSGTSRPRFFAKNVRVTFNDIF
jgi:hypothetical protein